LTSLSIRAKKISVIHWNTCSKTTRSTCDGRDQAQRGAHGEERRADAADDELLQQIHAVVHLRSEQ
jgi:hypothetical protein